MAVTEFLSFQASEAYLADPVVLDDAMKGLQGIKGHISAQHGIEVENGVTAHAFLEWETLQDHMNFKNDKPVREPLLEKLKLGIAGPFKMEHFDFKPAPSTATSAPTTAIVRVTLKEGKSKEELASLLDKMSQVLNVTKGAYPPTCWGPCVEHEDTFMQLIGWESVEAHHEAIQSNNDVFTEIIGPLSELADIKQSHVKLSH